MWQSLVREKFERAEALKMKRDNFEDTIRGKRSFSSTDIQECPASLF